MGNKTSYGYDADGNRTAQARPNSTAAALSYDAADQLTQIKDTGPAGTILNLPYTYDPVANLSSANATATAQPITQTYGYDQLNRLTGATVPAGNSGGAQSNGYAYDAANNLTQITTGAVTTTLTHDAANQLTATVNPSGTTSYSNDPNGNRTRVIDAVGNTTNYGYDQANRLTNFSGPPLSAANSSGALTESATYTYNGDGLRVAKQISVSGSTGAGVTYPFTWDLAAAVPLALTDGTNSYIYGAGDQPIEQISSVTGTVSWLLTDRQGSVRALTNTVGAVTATINYSPYGQTISTTGTVNTPLGYDGQYTDPESGLIYLRARYYDPTTGQFVTRDPLNSITQQPYGYGNDSPLKFADPSGKIDVNACDYSLASAGGGPQASIADYGWYYLSPKEARDIGDALMALAAGGQVGSQEIPSVTLPTVILHVIAAASSEWVWDLGFNLNYAGGYPGIKKVRLKFGTIHIPIIDDTGIPDLTYKIGGRIRGGKWFNF